jgi:hypothetical protein
VNSFKEMFSEMISGFEGKDIFNADDYELLFRAMPEMTIAMKDECKSGSHPKERLLTFISRKFYG